MKKLFAPLILLLLIACGKQQAITKLEVSIGAISGNFPAGLVLSAHHQETGEKQTHIVTTNNLELELSYGTWDFLAVTWTGASDFVGTAKCSKILNKSISNPTETVSFNLTQANCFDTDIVPAGSWDTYSNPMMMYDLTVSTCQPQTTLTAITSNYNNCPTTYTGMVTGLQISLAGEDNSTLQSSCLTGTSGSFYTGLEIIGGYNSTFQLPYKLTYFYGPNGCSGSSCCTGREETYNFSNNLNNGEDENTPSIYTGNYTNRLVVTEKTPPGSLKLYSSDISSGSATYLSCVPLTVALEDEVGDPLFAPTDINFDLSCENCSFYSDNTCTTVTSGASTTMLQGNATKTLYYKVDGAQLKLWTTGTNDYAGDVTAQITATETYSMIDHQYLSSITSFYNIGTNFSPTTFQAGDLVVYQTVDGTVTDSGRGVLEIVSISTTTNANDTIVMNFKTYDSFGTLVASGTNITTVASFSGGTCKWDLDNNTTPVGPTSVSGDTDMWWQTSGSNVYLSVQYSLPFRTLP